MIHYKLGDLLESNCDYICHQVNCQGVMRSGIAKQIREKWPEVYDVYKQHTVLAGCITSKELLGTIDVVKINYRSDRYVINMYSQAEYGYDGSRFTSYDAFAEALEEIRKAVPIGKSIGFPKNIGCGLGGGNWDIVSAMIEAVLGRTHNVYIYEPPMVNP